MPTVVTMFLASHVTEISVMMATLVVLFADWYLTDYFILKTLRKRNLFSRTTLFLVYALLALPFFTLITAHALATFILQPLNTHIWPLLLGFFVVSGVLLSIKYRMKLY